MKVFREWRISGDLEWLRGLWPKVKRSLDYCIETWDPGHKGVVEEPIQDTTGGPLLTRSCIGLFDLVHDLVLSENHRVQAAGHAEEVPARLLATELVHVAFELAHRQVAGLCEKGQHVCDGRRLQCLLPRRRPTRQTSRRRSVRRPRDCGLRRNAD